MSRFTQFVSPFLSLRPAAWFSMMALACLSPISRADDALQYSKNYFVTGDYAVAGVGLRGTGTAGAGGSFATGVINLSGVPAGADIVAAFLYWQTLETGTNATAAKGFFDGKAIVGAVRGKANNPACASNGALAPSGTWERAVRCTCREA